MDHTTAVSLDIQYIHSIDPFNTFNQHKRFIQSLHILDLFTIEQEVSFIGSPSVQCVSALRGGMVKIIN